MFGLPPLG